MENSVLMSSEDRKNLYISRYRQLANLDENFQICEDNIDEYALARTCVEHHVDSNKLKCQLLGKEWKGYSLNEN